jgi:hypothetical protein
MIVPSQQSRPSSPIALAFPPSGCPFLAIAIFFSKYFLGFSGLNPQCHLISYIADIIRTH